MASNDRRSDPRDFGRWCTIPPAGSPARGIAPDFPVGSVQRLQPRLDLRTARLQERRQRQRLAHGLEGLVHGEARRVARDLRSEEHTSELQSLMRISYAVFCLKKKIKIHNNKIHKVQPP